jgi:hypothetical protein
MDSSILSVPSPFGGPENPYVQEESPIGFLNPQPTHNFVMRNSDGKEAVVEFGHDTVTYSGDMPVDEAAKQFFEAVLSHWRNDVRR